MELVLEELGERILPSPSGITPEVYPAPPNMDSFVAALVDTAVLYTIGQVTGGALGISYQGPGTVVVWDVPDAVYPSVTGFPAYSTSRTVLPIFGGQLPIVFIPESIYDTGGLDSPLPEWELGMFARGWWYQDQDAPGFGPQHGQSFTPPDALLAIDALLALA